MNGRIDPFRAMMFSIRLASSVQSFANAPDEVHNVESYNRSKDIPYMCAISIVKIAQLILLKHTLKWMP